MVHNQTYAKCAPSDNLCGCYAARMLPVFVFQAYEVHIWICGGQIETYIHLSLCHSKAEKGLNTISRTPNSPLNRPRNAFGNDFSHERFSCVKFTFVLIVTGLGFGIMSGLTSYISQLAESSGPAILPCNSCPGTDVFFIGGMISYHTYPPSRITHTTASTAITTCLFIFLHAVWNMVAFDGWYRGQWLPFGLVVVAHFAASYGVCFQIIYDVWVSNPLSCRRC